MTTSPTAGPTPARTTPPDAGTPTRVTLVALLTTATLELVRACGPLLDRTLGTAAAGAVLAALVTFAGAGLLVAVLLVVSGRRGAGSTGGQTVVAATVLLAVARLLVQGLDGTPRTVVGLVTAGIALAALTLAVAFVAGRPTGGRQAALGLVVGTGLSVGLQLASGTWDPLWRHDVQGWVLTAVLVTATVGVARSARTHGAVGRPRRLWALGPHLALATLVLANPAFAAAQSGVALHAAGLVLVAGTGIAVWFLLNPHLLGAPVRVAAAAGIPATVAGALLLPGWPSLVATALLEVCAGVALAGAMSTRRPARAGLAGTAVAAGVVGLGLVVPLLVTWLDADGRVRGSAVGVPVLAGVALAIGGLRRRTPEAPGTWTGGSAGGPAGGSAGGPAGGSAGSVPLGGAPTATTPAAGTASPTGAGPGTGLGSGPGAGAGPGVAADATPPSASERQPFRANAVRLLMLPALVLALIGWWSSAPGRPVPERTSGQGLTVLDWNLHGGIEPAAGVDLERIARTIEQADPDVVTLQEVPRGWARAGGVDLATWLSHRLGMQVVWASADGAPGSLRSPGAPAVPGAPVGSAILSRSRLTATTTADAGRTGTHGSAVVSSTVTLADGTTVRLTSAHLRDDALGGADRLAALSGVLRVLPSGGAAILAGDVGGTAGGPEAALTDGAGWAGAGGGSGGAGEQGASEQGTGEQGTAGATYPADAPSAPVDTVLGRGVTVGQVRVLPQPWSSDHLPMLVAVTIG